MSLMRCLCLRKFVYSLAGAMLLGFATTVSADPKPLTKEEQAKVDKAIDNGVAFLKHMQRDKGNWPLSMRGNFPVGQTLLPAYALLESDVPANDPVIQKVADLIRPRIRKVDRTYELSLALLFFDRLGEKKDEPLIRSLALRLLAGQHVTGGWNYRCPIVNKEQEDILSKALAELNKRQKARKSASALSRDLDLPRSLKVLPIFRNPRTLPWRDPPHSKDNTQNVLFVGTTDNSNTQFAILGLWAAQRHDVPVGPSFRLMVERFERSQQADGWWAYELTEIQGSSRQADVILPSMICVGLMGLAVGRALELPTPRAHQSGGTDLRILKGLAALSQDIGVAATGTERASIRGVYYLWSLERVAMLYDLATIGDKEWYRWGAGLLLASQRSNGSWEGVALTAKDRIYHCGSIIDTSFALLFLKHSHPMKDLTPKLPVKGKELNQGIARLLTGKTPLEQSTASPGRSDKPKR